METLVFLLVSASVTSFVCAQSYPPNNSGLGAEQQFRAAMIPCQCSFPTCNCCAQFGLFPESVPAQLGCAELSYDGEDIGLRLKLQVGGRTLYDNELSAANPPPACVSPPMLPVVGLCARVYDIRLNPENAKACLKFEFQVVSNAVASLDFQCLQVAEGGIGSQPSG